MDSYSLWADVLTTFRSSSDLVKIVWLLMPVLLVLSLLFAVVKLRKSRTHPKSTALPLMTFQTGSFGTVTVVRTEAGLELLSLDAEGTLTPLLHISRRIMQRIGVESDEDGAENNDSNTHEDTPAVTPTIPPET